MNANSAQQTKSSESRARPAVSVIIPAYNVAKFINETIASVFAQTFRDFEVILINDGSPDAPEMEREIAPFREQIIYLTQKNGGAASARNAGLRIASGEYIAFLDGDDVWLPDYLDAQIKFLEQHDFDLVYADAHLFGENVAPNRTFMKGAKTTGAVVTLDSLLTGENNIINSGTIVRRAKIAEVGEFDESDDFRPSQDYEMWLRLAKAGARISYQTEVLLKYRIRTGSLTADDRAAQSEQFLRTYRGIKAKNYLDARETALFDVHAAVVAAEIHAEKAKQALLDGDFAAAQTLIDDAAPFYSRRKIAVVKFALRVAPRMLQKFYQRRTIVNV